MTPSDLVAETKPDEYNEVLLRSTNLQVQGLAVKHMVRYDSVIDTPAQASQLRALAEAKGLPSVSGNLAPPFRLLTTC